MPKNRKNRPVDPRVARQLARRMAEAHERQGYSTPSESMLENIAHELIATRVVDYKPQYVADTPVEQPYPNGTLVAEYWLDDGTGAGALFEVTGHSPYNKPRGYGGLSDTGFTYSVRSLGSNLTKSVYARWGYKPAKLV